MIRLAIKVILKASALEELHNDEVGVTRLVHLVDLDEV